MMQRRVLVPILLVCAMFGSKAALYGQAAPTAAKLGDLQIGAGYLFGHPDFSPHNFSGASIFVGLDITKHFGFEAEYHTMSGDSPTISENSFEGGGRFRYPIGPFSPYLKVMAGGGRFSLNNNNYQTGTYGLYSGGGGIDFQFLSRPRIVFRADYEYQRWGGFPPSGLQPNMGTIGIAYRLR